MRIAELISLKNGKSVIEIEHAKEWREIADVIARVDSSAHRTRRSGEKTNKHVMLASPSALNKAFKTSLHRQGWETLRVNCDYTTDEYVSDYSYEPIRGGFREMSAVKSGVGVDLQFSQHTPPIFSACAKMTIFRNLGHIHAGVEIVPMKDFAVQMSSGVSYFEQIVWDLKTRGEADIDIPVLVVGVTS